MKILFRFACLFIAGLSVVACSGDVSTITLPEAQPNTAELEPEGVVVEMHDLKDPYVTMYSQRGCAWNRISGKFDSSEGHGAIGLYILGGLIPGQKHELAYDNIEKCGGFRGYHIVRVNGDKEYAAHEGKFTIEIVAFDEHSVKLKIALEEVKLFEIIRSKKNGLNTYDIGKNHLILSKTLESSLPLDCTNGEWRCEGETSVFYPNIVQTNESGALICAPGEPKLPDSHYFDACAE